MSVFISNHSSTYPPVICFPEMGDHLVKHGDGVKDIAFEVEDIHAIFKVSALVKALFSVRSIAI